MRRIAHLSLVLTTALIVPAVASAQDVRTSVDVAGTVGYSNNPFAATGDDTGSAFIGLDVLPSVSVTSAQSTLTVSGAVRLQQYLRRYSRNDSYLASVDYNVRPSERLTAHARLDVSSAVIGGYDSYVPTLVPGGIVTPGVGLGTGVGTGIDPSPGVIVPPPVTTLPTLNDLALYGQRNRRRFGHLGGDASYALSARDSVVVSGYAEVSRYDRLTFSDYTGYNVALGYSRQVSASMNLGVRGSATTYDYDGADNNTHIYSLEGTARLRFSERWSLDGALGASFVDNDAPGSTRNTSLSGNINLCGRGVRERTCITAARQVSATGLVGSQYVTTGGISWSRKLSEFENLNLNASYSKVGNDNQNPLQTRLLANEFARFAAGYDRRLSERLRLIASANVRKLYGSQDSRPLDYGGQIGLSARLGDPR